MPVFSLLVAYCFPLSAVDGVHGFDCVAVDRKSREGWVFGTFTCGECLIFCDVTLCAELLGTKLTAVEVLVNLKEVLTIGDTGCRGIEPNAALTKPDSCIPVGRLVIGKLNSSNFSSIHLWGEGLFATSGIGDHFLSTWESGCSKSSKVVGLPAIQEFREYANMESLFFISASDSDTRLVVGDKILGFSSDCATTLWVILEVSGFKGTTGLVLETSNTPEAVSGALTVRDVGLYMAPVLDTMFCGRLERVCGERC